MVIQRIQTLYLIIAIGLMVGFFFLPFGYMYLDDPVTGQSLSDNPDSLRGIEFLSLIIPNGLSLLFMTLAIFLFKQPNVQKLFVILAAICVGVCVGIVIYVLAGGFYDTNPEVTIRTVWGGGGLLLVAAWLAQLGAYRGIASDQRLLRSYDRIR